MFPKASNSKTSALCRASNVATKYTAAQHWTQREVDESAFKDARLGRRCAGLLKQIGDAMGESIPYACQDWANTKRLNEN